MEGNFELLFQVYECQNRVPDFVNLISEFIGIFKSQADATELVREQGLRMFADLLMKASEFKLAEPLYIESIELLEASPIPNKRFYCSALANLGARYRDNNRDFDTAERYIRLALAQRQIHQGLYHFDTAQTRKNLAHLLRLKGVNYFKEARTLYLESIRILILNKGHDNQQLAKWIRDFAMLDLDESLYWLARIKFNYAYDLYMKLGCIQTFQPPITLMPFVPEGSQENVISEQFSFPPVPYGPLHQDLTDYLALVDAYETWFDEGIRLFKRNTNYNNSEIAKLMGVPTSMVEGSVTIYKEETA